jgi:hypothetical protein
VRTCEYKTRISEIETSLIQGFVALGNVEDYLHQIIVCTENNPSRRQTQLQTYLTTSAEKTEPEAQTG